MRVTKSNILVFFLLIPASYGISMLLLTNYTLGDQIDYWRFYEALSLSDVADVMRVARSEVASVEPFSAYLLWFGAVLGVDKNVYISVLNIILILGIFFLMRKYNVPWYVQVLIFSNFYVVTLVTAAERLKIAYILLVYGAVVAGKIGVALTLISPLAHLQSGILLGVVAVSRLSGTLRSLFKSKPFAIGRRILLASGFLFLVGLVLFLYLQQGLMYKVPIYMASSKGASELVQIALLTSIALLVTRDRYRMVIVMLLMMIATLLLGGARVNMIAFTVFLYLIVLEGGLKHPAVLLLLGYFSLKSIFFVKNIFVYNSGFGGWLL